MRCQRMVDYLVPSITLTPSRSLIDPMIDSRSSPSLCCDYDLDPAQQAKDDMKTEHLNLKTRSILCLSSNEGYWRLCNYYLSSLYLVLLLLFPHSCSCSSSSLPAHQVLLSFLTRARSLVPRPVPHVALTRAGQANRSVPHVALTCAGQSNRL